MDKNKKIKNASQCIYNNIVFKSKLELSVYKYLLDVGLHPTYETKTFVLLDSFYPSIPFYTKNNCKKKNKNYEIINGLVAKDNRKVNKITYTPDFFLEYKNKKIIIEVKGRPNDVFPLKFKLFRALLEKTKEDIILFEIFSITQLKLCINLLMNSQNI